MYRTGKEVSDEAKKIKTQYQFSACDENKIKEALVQIILARLIKSIPPGDAMLPR
jgi:hypothetical protein